MLCATQAHHVYSELDKNLHTLLDRSARTSRGRPGGATSTHFLFRYVNVGIVNAWAARDYSKVLLIDIDLFPLYRNWFRHQDDKEWRCGQRGGINAGIILLEPSQADCHRMQRDVTEEKHPEHVGGSTSSRVRP